MKYKIYRLKFTSAVHFGNGRLGSTDSTFLADRLFSAMCIEALKLHGNDGIEKLVSAAKDGRLLISDGMPYIGDTYFIPKPTVKKDAERSAAEQKSFKKLNYISADKLDEFLSGKLDQLAEVERFSGLGKKTVKSSAAIFENDDAKPYNVGIFEFKENSGLYFIFGYADEEACGIVGDIMNSLGYSGIGGKISSGLGKFSASLHDIPADMEKRLTGDMDRYMSLSVCMAKENELESALENADYSMIKRSGFISSENYSDTQLKRRTMHFFTAGSCFDNRFEGDVFSVGGKGSHPVYRYGKPLFMGVQ